MRLNRRRCFRLRDEGCPQVPAQWVLIILIRLWARVDNKVEGRLICRAIGDEA